MNSYLQPAQYAVAGVRRVLVATQAAGTRFRFRTTAPVLLALAPAPTWYALDTTDATQATQTSTREKTGVRHAQKLSLVYTAGLNRQLQDALVALFAQPVWCLFEDLNGNWWLAGRRRGMRCTSLQFGTGPRGGETTVTATLEGSEPEAWAAFDAPTALALHAAAVTAALPPDDPGGGDDTGGGDTGS